MTSFSFSISFLGNVELIEISAIPYTSLYYMLVSIIIPCFNEKEYIEEIVKRILKQDSIDKEIIIIDDGSTDGTTEILKNNIDKRIFKYFSKIRFN